MIRRALFIATLIFASVAPLHVLVSATLISTENGIKLEGHQQWLTSLAWLPDGNLLSGDFHGNAILWDLKTQKPSRSFDAIFGGAEDLVVFDEGRRYFTRASLSIVIGNVLRGRQIRAINEVKKHPFNLSASLSPDTKAIAIATSDSQARLFSAETGKVTAELKAPRNIGILTYAPDGRLLVTNHEASHIDVFEKDATEPVFSLSADVEYAHVITVNADSSMVAVMGRKEIRIAPLKPNAKGVALPHNAGELITVAWTPDGTKLATAGSKGLIEIWDPITSEVTETVQLEKGQTCTLAFSPDGKFLAVGGGYYFDFDANPPKQGIGENAIRVIPVAFAPAKASNNPQPAAAQLSPDVVKHLEMLSQRFDAARKRIPTGDSAAASAQMTLLSNQYEAALKRYLSTLQGRDTDREHLQNVLRDIQTSRQQLGDH